MAKKKAENSKATVAKAAKEERANAKERASAKAAEDRFWEAAGDGAPKSKSAAKKEQQVNKSFGIFPCRRCRATTENACTLAGRQKSKRKRRDEGGGDDDDGDDDAVD